MDSAGDTSPFKGRYWCKWCYSCSIRSFSYI
jgi:hypothetical protein